MDRGDDYGVDSIYIFVDSHLINDTEDLNQFFNNESKVIVRIIQAKEQSGFKEEALLKLRDGIENIFEIDKPLKGNAELKQKGSLIREAWTKWHDSGNKKDFDVIIDYATLGKLDEINYKVVDKKNKILEFLSYIGLKTARLNFVDQKILFDISSIQKYSKVLEAINYIEYDIEHNKDVCGYLLIVDGRKFYDFLVDDKGMIDDKIFELNVRDYQEESKDVIKNIKTTLNSINKSNFWCMNNGITILTSNIKRQFIKKFNLENYFVINGCQTSYALWEVLKEKKDIKNFEIIVKLVQTTKDDVALEIIQATNSQIPVDIPSLKSQEPIHKAIEEFFKSSHNQIFYERRKNFYRRRVYAANKIINPKKLYQIVKSIYFKKPSPARRSPTIGFKEDHDKMFKIEYDMKYYKFACLLYLKVISLIKKYKKEYDLDDFELAVINNARLHVTRILFALLFKSDDYLNLKKKTSLLCKKYDDYIKKLEKLTIDNKEVFIKSVEILEKAVTKFKKDEGDISVSNIFKNSAFDEKYLDKEVKNFLKIRISCLNISFPIFAKYNHPIYTLLRSVILKM